MGKSGVPSFWAAILLAFVAAGLENCGVSIALETGMKALDESLELDSLRVGFAKSMFGQLAWGVTVFIQAYGQKAPSSRSTVCIAVGIGSCSGVPRSGFVIEWKANPIVMEPLGIFTAYHSRFRGDAVLTRL